MSLFYNHIEFSFAGHGEKLPITSWTLTAEKIRSKTIALLVWPQTATIKSARYQSPPRKRRESWGRRQPLLPGALLAPDGIDLAVASVAVQSADPQAARWAGDTETKIGDEVFAVGNPHGLGWTHTTGTVSQFRQQNARGRTIRVIQTNTAINPGNSGGGLYDKQGRLVGITTWTQDKRVAEGLSFAIAFETLLKLNPEVLNLAARNSP